MHSLPDQSIDAVITDPPFNATIIGNQVTVKDKSFATINESWNTGFTLEWLNGLARLVKPSGTLITFCTHHILRDYLNYFYHSSDWTFRQILHWKKTNPFPSVRPYYTFSIEYVLWYTRNSDDTKYTFNIDAAKHWFHLDGKFKKHDTYFSGICQGKERTEHPSQKPLHLMKALIEVHTNVGDIVLDPFSGSGTTAVACQELRRRFIVIERDAKYVQLSRQRISEHRQQDLI